MTARHLPFVVAVGGVTLLSYACGSGDRDTPGGDTSFLPPQTTSTGMMGTGGDGGAGESDVCACLIHFNTEQKDGINTCKECWDESIQPGEPCRDPWLLCGDDEGCSAIISCAGNCWQQEVADIPACIGNCAYPADRDAATELYHQRLGCFCQQCGFECEAAQADECPVTGLGGAGGDGGAGGS